MHIFASTEDILNRSGLNKPKKVSMYEVITVANFELSSYTMDTNYEDLQ